MRTNTLSYALTASVFAFAFSTLPFTFASANDGTDLIVQGTLFADRQPLHLQTPIMGARESHTLVPQTPPMHKQLVQKPVDTNPQYAFANADLAALYYYAKQRQHERVDAEIARLQVLHPGFTAPADLYVTAQKLVPNEQPLWDMFAVDDFTGIDAEIVRRKTEDPKWKPTEDFSTWSFMI